MNTLRIAGIAVRELLFERVFYILVCFAIASLAFGMLLGQMTYAEQSKLTLDFMLGATHISILLFCVFMGISLFQRELTSGSICMVLSKPISRTTFLLGKYLGQVSVQFVMVALMGLLTVLLAGQLGNGTMVRATTQTVALIACEAAVLTALTYVFAVNTGAITTAVLTLALFALGHTRGLVASNLRTPEEMALWRAIRTVVPDLEVFNMKHLASYGQFISWPEFGWATLYAFVCVGFLLVVASVCFERKDIHT